MNARPGRRQHLPGGGGLITVDWEPGNAPAMVTLTHEGIRHVEAEEEGTARGPA
ncbi:hypothetical protein [Streptomyces sp. NPDC002467]|uniref:hypothetical protein n=1 Tax=Streptomyces sp. NPDC002467 TaxID=3364647 RepID=UPI00368F906E